MNNFDIDARHDPLLADYERARDLLPTPDWRRGLDEMERLAHAGSIMSILHVSDAMRWGWGYEQDLPGAEAWYKVAIESGSARGLYGLGFTYRLMGRFSEAIQNFEAAIARDYSPAYNLLACMHFEGQGVPVDKQRARELWRKGASLGHLPANLNLLHKSFHGHYGFWARIGALLNFLPVAMETSIVKVTNRYTDRLR